MLSGKISDDGEAMMPPRLPPVFMKPHTAMVSPRPTFMAAPQYAPSVISTEPKQAASAATARYGLAALTASSRSTAAAGRAMSGTSL